jgi:hypothetical protein
MPLERAPEIFIDSKKHRGFDMVLFSSGIERRKAERVAGRSKESFHHEAEITVRPIYSAN